MLHSARLLNDQRGVALIEGVLILGILIVVLMEMIVVTQFYGANVRVSQAADGIANMVSQERLVASSAINDFDDAAAHFLLPYAPPSGLTVAQLVFLPDGTPSIAVVDGGWMLSSGASMTTGADLENLAVGLGLPGEALIVVELLHNDPNRLQFGPTFLPAEIDATAYAKTRSGRPVLIN